MSYEGSVEFICECGHYSVFDCYDVEPTKCPECDGCLAYTHSIDETNGTDFMDPNTMPGSKRVVGGQRKVVEIPLYAAGPEWTKLS